MNSVATGARADRVLVVELAGIGDNVHLLPALWLVRRQWPAATLGVLVNARAASLFSLTPWVDRVWAYANAPRPGPGDTWRLVRELRRERFDCVINTTGSDRSSLLTFATGARVRIGRRPADGGPPGWRLLYTNVVESPYYVEPMFWQKWRCVRQAGIGVGADFDTESASDKPEFHLTIDAGLRRAAGIGADDEHRYVHISPFTTSDDRELPAAQLAALVAALRRKHPALAIVVSCAPGAREQDRLRGLLAILGEPPWKVFAGTLSVAALAAVIETSALSFSGDTAGLHLALMTRAPAVAWFRAHKGQREWIPTVPGYRVVVSDGGAPDALHGIDTATLLAAANELLA